MKKKESAGWICWAEFTVGILLSVGIWPVGLETGWFLVHVIYPFAFWLVFDGLAGFMGEEQLLRHPATFLKLTLLGAAMGLILDFYMVSLTKVLDLGSVTDTGIALQMYLGWGFCLPAVYQSYRVFLHLFRNVGRFKQMESFDQFSSSAFAVFPFVAFPLAALPLFFRLWVGVVPGYFIAPSFLGFWLLSEYAQHRQSRQSLLKTILVGDFRPVLAMVVASLPFTLLWEALNALMGSWRYQNIFWLQPDLAGVPLVVFFGYFSGYYVIFLSVYSALREKEREDLW